jgi:hypothetical protein
MNAPATRNLNAAFIDSFANAYRNWDDTSRDHAVSRLGMGQPAFWHTVSSTNAVIAELCSRANKHGSLDEAQESLIDDFGNRRNYRSWEWLDRLIPLNDAAVRDLSDAYTRAATFRERIEIGVPCAETVRLPAARVMAPNLLDAVNARRVA